MISVVVPCFNEALNVARFGAELFPPLEALGLPCEVVAVDDGSTDGTRHALESLAAGLPLRVVAHERNRGLGAALRTGFSAAKGDWIVTLDADLTFAPDQIALLLKRQEETGADLVAGSPFLSAGGMGEVPWSRRTPSSILNLLYRLLFSWSFTAYTPIFRLYRSTLVKTMALSSEGFEINAEIAVKSLQAGVRLAEVPARLSERRLGASKLDRWRELDRHLRLMGRHLRGAAQVL